MRPPPGIFMPRCCPCAIGCRRNIWIPLITRAKFCRLGEHYHLPLIRVGALRARVSSRRRFVPSAGGRGGARAGGLGLGRAVRQPPLG